MPPTESPPLELRHARLGIRAQMWLLFAATSVAGFLAIGLAVIGQPAPSAPTPGLWLAIAAFTLTMAISALAIEPTVRAIRRQRQALRQQAGDLERLALVARSTANSVMITDQASRIVWVNDGFTRLWGYAAEESIGREPGSLLAGDRTDRAVLHRLSSARAEGRPERAEALYRGKDGVDRWVQIDLQPLLDANGRLAGSISVATDISELIRGRQDQAAILAASPNGVLEFDRVGRIIESNRVAGELLRLNREALVGRTMSEVPIRVLDEDLKPLAAHALPVPQVLSSGRPVRGLLLAVSDPEGELRWLRVQAEPLLDTLGQVERVIVCFVDVSEMRRQQQLLAATVDGAGLGLWEWDLRTHHVTCNERFSRMLGYRDGDLGRAKRGMLQLLHPEDRARWMDIVGMHLKDETQPCRMEMRLRRPDGQWAWATATGAIVERGGRGQPLRMAGVLVDMTEHMQMQAMLLHTARTDNLTQLPNRAWLMERLEEAVRRWQGDPDRRFALLYMDFDRFKFVNDTHGHAMGDALLRQIADRLLSILRRSETQRGRSQRRGSGRAAGGDASERTEGSAMAARLGGDEFVVLLEDIDGLATARSVADRLLDTLAEPYSLAAGLRVHSSASIGLVGSEHCTAGTDAHRVLRDADTAMYEAKRAGRSRVVVFDPTMHQLLARRSEVEAELRVAIEQGHIVPAYQPIVDLASGRVVGVEALARWQHPLRGAISPVEFIPVAEESGLIRPLGVVMLQSACRDFVRWQERLGDAAPAHVAVNLSRAQLMQEGLVEDVALVIHGTGIAPHRLQLEVTESLAGEENRVRLSLQGLKSLGVQLALDDFGTGYSSLACLHLMPVDTVKIDRSFVRDAQDNEVHRVLIQATVQVAQALGMRVVAEGVESQRQVDLVRALGCGRAQGYHYSHPLFSADLESWLDARAREAA